MRPVDIFTVTNMSIGFYLLLNLIQIGVSIYAIVVLSKGIGLVHNFSALRGFGSSHDCDRDYAGDHYSNYCFSRIYVIVIN